MSTNKPAKKPDWLLERIKLKEIDTGIGLNDEDKNRINELERSDTEILKKYSPRLIAAQIRYKLDKNEHEIKSFLSFEWLRGIKLIPLAGIILFLIIFVPVTYQLIDDGNRTKGLGPYLNIYKQSGAKAVRLSNNDKVKQGDLIQVVYSAQGYRYGVIFSIDGDHSVTLHLPENSSESAMLEQSANMKLNSSIELDNAKDFERFYFVYSNKPFDAFDVIQDIKNNLNKSDLTDKLKKQGLFLSTFNLRK